MSVTRLIPANTPSQVNAENIGVQIQLPPPTTVIDSITVDYNYETVDPSDLIYLDANTLAPSNTPGLSCANLDGVNPDTGDLYNADLIYDEGSQITIESDTYEKVIGLNGYEFYFNTTDGFQNGTSLYEITDDGQGNYTANPASFQIGQMLTSSSSDLCIFEPMNGETGYGQAIDTNGDYYEMRLIGGNWVIFNENLGCYVCFVGTTTNRGMTLVAYPYNYTPGVETPKFQDFTDYTQTPPAVVPYWVWDTNGEVQYPLVAGTGWIATLVAPENVQVGDTVIFADVSVPAWNYNRMTVSSVQSHQEQGETPTCQVSYSVDGETFTTHPDVLTDSNNVICNIPRYMYLRFSQDVLITEE